jgi:hypothetical protein
MPLPSSNLRKTAWRSESAAGLPLPVAEGALEVRGLHGTIGGA